AYTEKGNDSITHIVDASTGNEVKEFRIEELNKVFFERGDQPFESMPKLYWLKGKELGVTHNGYMWKYNWETSEIMPLYTYDPKGKTGHHWNDNLGTTFKEGSTLKVVSPKTQQTIGTDK